MNRESWDMKNIVVGEKYKKEKCNKSGQSSVINILTSLQWHTTRYASITSIHFSQSFNIFQRKRMLQLAILYYYILAWKFSTYFSLYSSQCTFSSPVPSRQLQRELSKEQRGWTTIGRIGKWLEKTVGTSTIFLEVTVAGQHHNTICRIANKTAHCFCMHT